MAILDADQYLRLTPEITYGQSDGLYWDKLNRLLVQVVGGVVVTAVDAGGTFSAIALEGEWSGTGTTTELSLVAEASPSLVSTLYTRDHGGSVSELVAEFPSGEIHVLATQGHLSEDVEIKTSTPNSVPAAGSGRTYSTEGSAGLIQFSLPSAAAGLCFGFVVQNTNGLQVYANTGDTVRLGASVSAAGGYAKAVDIGCVLELLAINATEWIATKIVGGWEVA